MRVADAADTLLIQVRAAGLPEPEREVRFAPPRRWRFDLAWRDHLLAVEVDGAVYAGGRHTRGKGYERDAEKLNTAVLMGWRVLRFSTGMVASGEALATLEQALKEGG